MTRIFSPEQLQTIIQHTIPAVTDATHTHAIVGGLDEHGAQVVAHFEYDPHKGWVLDMDGVARRNWSGERQVGAQVILKF